MESSNKAILEAANAAVTRGDNEGFLAFCTEDTEWTFVGEQTLHGKQAVRDYMKVAYAKPPQFRVENLIGEGEFLIAMGNISMEDEQGQLTDYRYCDVWRFREGKMASLEAFVIKLR